MPSRRTLIRTIIISAIVFIGAWVAYDRAASSAGSEAKDQGPPDGGGPSATPVVVTDVEASHQIESLAAVGTLEPSESVAIRNEVAGRIETIGFAEGESVEAGQVMVELATDDLDAQIATARRERDFLQDELQRRRGVLENEGVTQQEVDELEADYDLSRARIEELVAERDKRVIRAPFDGVVGLRSVSPGAVLDGSTEIATLRKLDPLKVVFSVPGRHAGSVEVGQEIYFLVPDADDIFEATVTATESGLAEGSRSLEVQGEVANPDGQLVAGAVLRLRTVLGQRDDVLTVPAAAVIQSAEGPVVWVDDDGKAHRREVEVGERSSNQVEIVDGLEEGEKIIIAGFHDLSDGQEVDSEAADTEEIDIGPDEMREGRREMWGSRQELEQMLRTAQELGEEL